MQILNESILQNFKTVVTTKYIKTSLKSTHSQSVNSAFVSVNTDTVFTI